MRSYYRFLSPLAPRAPVPSLHHHLGHSIPSSCDRTGARSIVQVRGTQRGGPCHGHRVLGLAPRSRVATDMREVLARARLVASPSPLDHLGAQREDPLLGIVARACPLPGARAHDSIGKVDAQEDAPMPRRLARKCLWPHDRCSPCARIGRHGMVAAFGKAATATHGRQRNDRAKRIGARLGAGIVLLSRPGPSARLGRRPPAASFPPGPPNLGTPLARFARWDKESPGGKYALAPRAI